MSSEQYVRGLEGIIAAESSICSIDGEQGLLYYRGYSIEELVKKCNFEEVCYLLLYGELPDAEQIKEFSQYLRSSRELNEQTLNVLKQSPERMHPMEVLQSAVLYMSSPDVEKAQSAYEMLYLVSQIASATACLYRFRNGQDYVPPRTDLGHGANFLYMMHGSLPSEQDGEVMDKCLILHAEHSFNASTFTGRVVAATLSSYPASVSAAIGALSGSLHGGANERVIDMLKNIQSPDRVSGWLDDALGNNRKITGFGHRVYKTKDPRATSMESFLDSMTAEHGSTTQSDILKLLESEARKRLAGKSVYPNVDFFSGVVYLLMDIPPLFFTPIFAVARMIGWLTHIQEQLSDNRLFRPSARYVGHAPRKLAEKG